MLGAGRAALSIAFVSSVGAIGAAPSPTFIGWIEALTGGFTGAVEMLAGVMFVAMAVLWFSLPAVPRRGSVAEPLAAR